MAVQFIFIYITESQFYGAELFSNS